MVWNYLTARLRNKQYRALTIKKGSKRFPFFIVSGCYYLIMVLARFGPTETYFMGTSNSSSK